jgi:predicted nucleic acid-binding protein
VIRIVLDSNVLVSALVCSGIPRGVLELAEAGQCEFFYSQVTQSEVRRVLSEKFDWSQPMLHAVLPVVWRIGKRLTPQIMIMPLLMIQTITASLNSLSPRKLNS